MKRIIIFIFILTPLSFIFANSDGSFPKLVGMKSDDGRVDIIYDDNNRPTLETTYDEFGDPLIRTIREYHANGMLSSETVENYTGRWESYRKIQWKYSATDKLLEKRNLVWANIEWLPEYERIYLYNKVDTLVEEQRLTYVNDHIYGDKYEWTHNADGTRATEVLSEKNAQGEWVQWERVDMGYSADKQLVSMIKNRFDSTQVNTYFAWKGEYTYNDLKLEASSMSFYYDTVWYPIWRNETQYNSVGLLTYRAAYNQTDTSWFMNYKIEVEYNAQNQIVTYTQSSIHDDGTPDAISLQSYEYDEKGSLLNSMRAIKKGNIWNYTSKEEYTYYRPFSSNFYAPQWFTMGLQEKNISLIPIKISFMVPGTLKEWEPYIVTNYIYSPKSEADSTAIEVAKSQQLQIYPNPATDKINISIQESSATALYLYDLSGRLIKMQNFSLIMDISNLLKGSYILQVKNKTTLVGTQKIIKL